MLLGIERVTKVFGKLRVNDEVSLSVDAGEVFGLLGPNDAGKTTPAPTRCPKTVTPKPHKER